MEMARKACRLCLSETDFNIPIHSAYCRKTNMIDKILVCLKIVIEETDITSTICYQCAHNVEKYYEYLIYVKKAQARQTNEFERPFCEAVPQPQVNRRVTSYVREQVIDDDYTFSFLEIPEEKKEPASSPFFSYFSPLNRNQANETLWKTPRPAAKEVKKEDFKKPRKAARQHSRDFFESQSQEAEEQDARDPRSLEWKLTPDDNIIKRVKDKFFGRSEF
ncbi:hypothetical protein O0L34_g10864 [Tuta absoluta]|nr:hypothetical protein O0L34_g10864 [Tuta absoluta]